MLVLPPKYVNELRMLPSTIASPTVAHAHNLMGSHTNMNIILRNNLHFRTLQLKLTPNLNFLTGPMQDEVNFAIEKEIPDSRGRSLPSKKMIEKSPNRKTDGWVTIKPYHCILRLVARVSARIFLGLPICRNEQWLEISTEFTENGTSCLMFKSVWPPLKAFISLCISGCTETISNVDPLLSQSNTPFDLARPPLHQMCEEASGAGDPRAP